MRLSRNVLDRQPPACEAKQFANSKKQRGNNDARIARSRLPAVRTKSCPPALPLLPKRLARGKVANEGRALLQLLREIALTHRNAQPQTFYSLRQVAENFALPVSLVGRVFRHLEEEGLVGRIRGSRTVLHGRKYDRNLHVRGVVGLPISVFRFAAFAEYRAFITQMRRQLRQRGFMPAAMFFERHETKGGLLTEKLLEARVDSVIWLSPDRECRVTVESLGDAGVRVLGVSDYMFVSIPCRYEIRRENALHAILREWHAAGLTSTIVVSEPRGRSALDEERCHAASAEEKLPSRMLLLEEARLKRMLKALAREKSGILLTASAAALCVLRVPEAFWQLMQKQRVALVDGPFSLLFARVPAVPVDLITVNWQDVASRIVRDLITQAAWTKTEPFVFQAEAQLRVALNRFCYEL